MRRCAAALMTSALIGCAATPAPLATGLVVSGVRIETADEAGDAWLHEHCVFHGEATVQGTADAVTAAQRQRSNFVEGLARSVDERWWSPSSSYDVALFACAENPPW